MKIITDGKQEPVLYVSNGRPMFISMVRPPFGDWEPMGVSFNEKVAKLRATRYANEFGQNLSWRVDTATLLTDEYLMIVASDSCHSDAKERTT